MSVKLTSGIRGKAEVVANKGGDAAIWLMCNRRKALAIGGALLAGFLAVSVLASPKEASAIPPILVVGAAIAAVGGVAFEAGNAAQGIEEVLRGLVVMMLSWCQTLVANTANSTLLKAGFETLLTDTAVHDAVRNVHHIAVIPLGNIVAAAFLVYGLVKVMSKAGQTDGGIDYWQLIMLFVLYGVASMVVNASWEIMTWFFRLFQVLVDNIYNVGAAALEFQDPTEGIENAGMLIAMALVSVVVVLVAVVVCALSHCVVIVRAIQIYVYSVFSPIPLACMVAEGGRDITKAFAKRYVALLLSGAVLAVLFYMFSLVVTFGPMPTMETQDIGGFAKWATELTLNYIVVYGAFGYAVFKSGSFARDLLGV